MINQSIEMLEKVAAILEQIPKTFVFTGGATILLYVDEVTQSDIRPTDDVDCVVEITSKGQYYQLAEKLRELGLEESIELNVPLCRWKYQEINIDIMPGDETVLGFTNRYTKCKPLSKFNLSGIYLNKQLYSNIFRKTLSSNCSYAIIKEKTIYL